MQRGLGRRSTRRSPPAHGPVGLVRESGMYARLTEHLCVTSASVQPTCAVCMEHADAVQLDVVAFVVPRSVTLTFDVQGSNDLQNWTTVNSFIVFTAGYHGLGPTTNIAWEHVRVLVTSDSASTAILAIGLNAVRLGSCCPGRMPRSKATTRLAEDLCVTSAIHQCLPAVSMYGDDAVQLNIVVFAIPVAGGVLFEVEGSNDQENWTTLFGVEARQVGYVGTGLGTAIDSRYVRVRVSATQAAPTILAIGLRTAKLGSSFRDAELEAGTYARLAEHVSVVDRVDQATYPVLMGDANRASVDIEVLASPGDPAASVVFYLEGSNDLQNWSSLAFNSAIYTGYQTLEQGGIAFQYIRIRFAASGNLTPFIVAAGVNAIAA